MATTTSTTTSTDYPWLSAVTFSDVDDAGRAVVSSPDGPVARVPAQVATLVRAAQGDGPDADPELLAAALQALDAVPAIRRARVPESGRPRRVQLRPPFSLQVTLLDPTTLMSRATWLAPVVRARATWWVLGSASVLAAITAAVLTLAPGSPLHRTLPVGGYLAVLAALAGGVFLHELAHAATVIAFGGRSRRVGVMLFYLAPAFFCDATDAWRLAPVRRAQVALAGVVTQGTLAAVGFAVMPFTPPDVQSALALFGLVNAGWTLVNLVPFIKLDGYVALAGYLDEPDLRAHCMAEARAVLTRAPLVRPTTALRVLYGLACIVFPGVVVLSAVLALGTVLAPLGRAGAWVALLAVATLATWGAGRVTRVLRAEPGTRRREASALAVGAALVTAVALVPLPVQAQGGYVTTADGPLLVLPTGGKDVPVGTEVTVRSPGLVPGTPWGTARVAGPSTPCEAPLDALVPVRDEQGLTLDASCWPLDAAPASAPVAGDTAEGAGTGSALADLRRQSLATQVLHLLDGVRR